MRILITGGRGMLGSALYRLAPAHVSPDPVGHYELDVASEASVRAAITEREPDAVIHCAAWTAVDACEKDVERAFRVNADGPKFLARETAKRGIRLVHISTDFVFDGVKRTPYVESDATDPLSVYGRSKQAGEENVIRSHPGALIVRTSWTFGREGDGDFVRSILSAVRNGTKLRVVTDQVGSPTYVDDLAEAIYALLPTEETGVFHVANTGETDRYHFARAVLDGSGYPNVPIDAIKAAELKLPAPRPAYSTLGSERLPISSLAALRDWRSALHARLTAGPAGGREY
ncbi:MAG: dTDP-4-dehydrorhamnose reductase [Gemmatimonadetes bacterium]|nr:dTDP-4-dehydrorhamnose reductase [Gemmatimonadota bacterium]